MTTADHPVDPPPSDAGLAAQVRVRVLHDPSEERSEPSGRAAPRSDQLERPVSVRRVPLLTEPSVGHYPEFARFLSATFGLDDDPLGHPGLLDVGGRCYELVFLGRSGEPFPSGVELNALVPGLEPLDVVQADRDLWAVLEWLIEGVGPPWSVDALRRTGAIYRIGPATPP